jgi:FAD-binding domain/Ferric reductase NAD binding domain
MSALHHPPLWWWCWFSLLIWAGERAWRVSNWVYVNGFLGSRVSGRPVASKDQKLPTLSENWEMHPFFPDVEPTDFAAGHAPELSRHARPSSYTPSLKPPLYHIGHLPSSTHSLLPPVPSTFSIPVGYAHAEVLAGRTIRLRLIPPGHLTWAPGQHFLLCIPSVSKFVSHPFTCASVCDTQKPGDDGRMTMFLIRAKNGWTKDLWTTVVGLLINGYRHSVQEAPVGTTSPATGVLLKAWVDGPFGSPARVNWSLYSTAMIVSGGSGVSFGISVLEYLCLCMSGRNGRYLGGNVGRSKAFSVRRIRFIWILRDFGELMSVGMQSKCALSTTLTQLTCNGAQAFCVDVDYLFHRSHSKSTCS